MMKMIWNLEWFPTCVVYAQDLTAKVAQEITEEFTSAVNANETFAQNVRRCFRAAVGAGRFFSVRIANLINVPILIVQRFFAMIA